MVAIDSDVFLIAHRYVRDVRAESNGRFLAEVKTAAPALTIYNLMEILGVLSFNLSAAQMRAWPDWLKARHSLAILWPELNYTAQHLFFEQIIYHLPLARHDDATDGVSGRVGYRSRREHPGRARFRHLERAPLRKQDSPAGADAREYLDENGFHPETRSVIR